MARIGLPTCSNSTQEIYDAALGCFWNLRKRRGILDRCYNDQKLDRAGIFTCAGCPILAPPEKIRKRIMLQRDKGLMPSPSTFPVA